MVLGEKDASCRLHGTHTFGFHTRTGKGPSSICFNRTGWGHDLIVCAVTSAESGCKKKRLPLVHDDKKSADYGSSNGIRV